MSERLLRLPFFNDITEDEQMHVINQVAAFLKRTPAEPRRWPFILSAGRPKEAAQ